MSKKDPDYVVKVERAIAEKYGTEAVDNPKKFWNQEKEKKHVEQLKQFYKDKEEKETKKVRKNNFLVSEKFLNNENSRECPVCGLYSFHLKDDLYMHKFQCCFKCYIQYVEGREERWKTGWRPNK
ncbi:MAG: hypothetical protein CBD26_03440 [Candidatus Pelagibacter sp. TMED166]|nr:MAG: hypothetical protein CBD26_03440 [Candidatus Pelagibacter sp. TMED166]|tara:strand:+ start:13575 stop:13949 length:375 start_codon:yes stop_codon:yes gene_type:complete